MSFSSLIDRVGRTLSGLADGAADIINMAADLTSLDPDENEQLQAEVDRYGAANGFASFLLSEIQGPAASAAGHAFGPDRGLGAAIGGLPQGVRTAVKEKYIDPAEMVERNALRGVAAVTRQTQTLLQGDLTSWRDAWEFSEDTTAGQAMALGVAGVDPLDPVARERVIQSPVGTLFSGAIDGLLLWYVPGPEEFVAYGLHGANVARRMRNVPGASRPGKTTVLDALSERGIDANEWKQAMFPELGELAQRRQELSQVDGATGEIAQIDARIADLNAEAERALRDPAFGPTRAIDRFFDRDRSWVSGGAGNITARLTGSGTDTPRRLRDRMFGPAYQRWEAEIEGYRADIDAELAETIDPEIADVTRRQQELAATPSKRLPTSKAEILEDPETAAAMWRDVRNWVTENPHWSESDAGGVDPRIAPFSDDFELTIARDTVVTHIDELLDGIESGDVTDDAVRRALSDFYSLESTPGATTTHADFARARMDIIKEYVRSHADDGLSDDDLVQAAIEHADQQLSRDDFDNLLESKDPLSGEVVGSFPDSLQEIVMGRKRALEESQSNYLELEAQRQRLEFQRELSLRSRMADRIHQRLGYKNVHNGHMASALAQATDAAERELVWRLFTGDPTALGQLRMKNASLFARIEDYKVRIATETQASGDPTAWVTQQILSNSDGVLKAMQGELEDLVTRRDRMASLENFYGVKAGDPLKGPGKVLRTAVSEKFVGYDPVSGRLQRLMERMPTHYWDTNNTIFMDRARMWLRDAGLDDARVEEIAGRLDSVQDAGARWRILENAEDEVVKAIATEYDISSEAVDAVLALAADVRQANRNLYRRGSKYGVMNNPDGTQTFVASPITRQQLADVFTPIDVADTRHQMEKFARWAERNPKAMEDFREIVDSGKGLSRLEVNPVERNALDYVSEAMNDVLSLWKAGRVARPAYPLRAMALDEGFRMVGYFGFGSTLAATAKGTVRSFGRFADDPNVAAKLGVLGGMLAGMAGADLGWAGGFAGLAYAAGKMMPRGNWAQVLGSLGNDFEAFGDTVEGAAAMRKRIMDPGTHEDLVRAGSELATRRIEDIGGLEATGRFEPIDPRAGGYEDAWVRAVNQQFREDEAFRQLLKGSSRDDLIEWMKTEEGIQWRLQADPSLSRGIPRWADELVSTRDMLFGGSAKAMETALKRPVTRHDVDLIPPTDRQIIPGEVMREIKDPGVFVKAARHLMDPLVEVFARLPSEELLRSPFYQMRYRELIAERLDTVAKSGGAITERQAAAFRAQARNQALQDMTDAMYSYADRSRFADMVRFLDPFFSPFENAVRAWWGIAKRNPVYTARLYDSFTRVIDNVIETRDEDGEEYRVIAIPEGLHEVITHIPWLSDLPAESTFTPDMSSLNVILQTPSMGPMAALLKPIVRANPELEANRAMEYIFPYGIGDESNIWGDLLNEITPTVVRRFTEQNLEGPRVQALRVQLMQNHKSRIAQGLEPDVTPGSSEWRELVERIEREADSLLALDTIAKNWSPAFTRVNTWAEPYIRAYRSYIEADPDTAQDRFLANYGEEFLPVVESVYKSNLSVPATPQTFEALANPDSVIGSKLAEVATDDPQLARLVVGTVGGADGDAAIEYWQRLKNMETTPGSGEPVVEVQPSLIEAFEETDVSNGWRAYLAFMDMVDNKMEEYGYTSLRQNDAAWLQAEVEAAREQLAQEYPAWWEDYNTPRRRDLWDVRRTHLEDLATTAPFSERPGMESLRTYLDGRDRITEQLGQREHSTLAAQSNEDLRASWEAFVTTLVTSDLHFSEVYRYALEPADPYNLEIDTQEEN